MWDKLKQLKQLANLQDQMKQERIEVNRQGVRVIMNGAMEVEDVFLPASLDLKSQERLLKEAFNEAREKIQGTMAKKFAGSFPGFN